MYNLLTTTAHSAICEKNTKKVKSSNMTQQNLRLREDDSQQLHLQACSEGDDMDVRVTTKARRDSEIGGTNLPFISELLRSGGNMPLEHPSVKTVDFPLKPDDQGGSRHESYLKIGTLYKTTLSRREGARPGPTRQRQFRLTEVALEYFHHFSHVCKTKVLERLTKTHAVA